ncbi:MAG TPA: MFS transporter [Stellaceae bacterium]|jgi:multidrug resistance protein|nr:MFS transporter [Stellaceae bacterium]
MPAETTRDQIGAAQAGAPVIAPERRVLIFIAALASVFITQIESTIVATAMPTIVGEIGGFELLSWVYTVYLLTQAVTTPLYGRLSDLYGRKPILLFGIGLFIAGSVLCGLAWDMPSLIVFRAIQGFGAGAISPVGRTLIGDIYHGADRARMQGWVSGVFIGAAVLGPVVGAFLVAHTIWQMVFWVNVPLGLIAGAILVLVLKEHFERRRARIDIAGSLLLALGSFVLLYALAQAAVLPGLWFAAFIALAVLVLAAFGFCERFAAEPIWPMSLWRDRMSTSGNFVSLTLGAAIMGVTAYLPVYVQGVMGESAMTAGLIIMSMSASSPIAAVAAGRIMLRTSYRVSASIGGVFFIAGTVMMAMLATDSGWLWVMTSGMLIGLGLGLNNNTYMVAIQAECGWNMRGVATGVFIFSRILGQALGAAAFGGILNLGLSRYLQGEGDLLTRILTPEQRATLPPETLVPLMNEFAHSLHIVFIILAVLAVATLAIGYMLPKGRSIRR